SAGQIRLDPHHLPCPSTARKRRTRKVRRDRGRIEVGQSGFPVLDITIESRPCELLLFPDGVVGVLNRQLWQIDGTALPSGEVVLLELLKQNGFRPAVEYRVMHGNRENTPSGRDLEQRGPNQGPRLEIERTPALVRGKLKRQRLVAHKLDSKLGTEARMYLLLESPVPHHKGRPEHLVAGRDTLQRSPECFFVERSDYPIDERRVVQTRSRSE